MRRDPIEQAIDEQLRGFVPAIEVNDGGEGYTRDQLFIPRRRTETILVEMADKIRMLKRLNEVKIEKHHRRSRRRGPKVLVYKA